jgi:hypothetical protein
MTKRTIVALFGALALTAGCNGGDGETDDTDTPTPSGCEITVSNASPSDGESAFYYRGSLSWEFSEPDDTATVTLADDGGADVPGSGEWIGDVYIWTPNDPLTPSTGYTATLTTCDGENTIETSFTTSAVGANVPDADIQDVAYSLDLASGTFVDPPGVGALLQSQLNVDILIGVLNADGATLELIGAIGEEGAATPTQDLCTESIDFPAADFSENPYFEVGPQTTTLEVQGISVVIDDLFVSGAFAPDSSAVVGAVLAGSIDTRPLAGLVGDDAPPEAVCDLAVTFGINCAACSDGSGDFCLSLLVTDIAADEVPGATVVPRAEADITADPNCQ